MTERTSLAEKSGWENATSIDNGYHCVHVNMNIKHREQKREQQCNIENKIVSNIVSNIVNNTVTLLTTL